MQASDAKAAYALLAARSRRPGTRPCVTPETLPGYTLKRPLGRGGMATVYLAVQESLGREVALKLLAPDPNDDRAAGERFLREARIAASLHHPHIVPIHDFGVHEGTAYLAMEYEPGGTIAPGPGERLAPREALRLVRDVAGALDYAHARGVVHRDIKPDNILRRADGAATLSDFGIARLIHGESLLTAEGTSVGTPQYMSPEQLRGDKVDGRSDLYSLGVVLWQLLTGELPYRGGDAWAIGSQHLNAPIPRLPEGLSPYQPLVDALLAKSPDARLQAGAELVQRIEALLAGGPATPPAATEVLPGQPTGATPSASASSPAADARRRWALLATGASLVLALGWLGWRQAADAPAPRAGQAAATPAAAATTESIAVLPFVDMSQAQDQGFFSDGLSEELLNQLTQVPQLRVIARTSSFAFKGKDMPVAEIARALDVDHVLEGSVRKSGNTLRVSAQLVRASDSTQLWSQTYDRDLTDVFKVQDDIAREVVAALRVKMLASMFTDKTQRTRNVAAYEQYLLGRDAWQAGGQRAVQRSIDAFERAVALDPTYANAYAELAYQQASMADFAQTEEARSAALDRALASTDKAVALAPDLAIAYAMRGALRQSWLAVRAGEADLVKAIELDPRNSIAQMTYGSLQFALGHREQGIAQMRQVLAFDPLSDIGHMYLASFLFSTGRKAESEQVLENLLTRKPKLSWPGFLLGNVLLSQGRLDEAVARYQACSEELATTGMAMVEFTRGNEVASKRALDKLKHDYAVGFAFQIAQVHAWRGETDEAFEWLERAYAIHDTGLIRLGYDPAMDPLRKDPRFRDLLERVGLPTGP